MAIVKTDKAWRFNMPVNLPGVGLQTPNHKGEFEAEDHKAEHLVKYQPDFYIKGRNAVDTDELKVEGLGPITEKSESDQLNPLVEGEPATEQNLLSGEEKEIYLATLPGKTRSELIEDCKAFGLPGGQWRPLNKAELIEYITSKI